MANQIDGVDVIRVKECAQVFDKRVRIVAQRRFVGLPLPAPTIANNMPVICKIRSERIEPMDVVADAGQEKKNIASTAPIHVMKRHAVHSDELILRSVEGRW